MSELEYIDMWQSENTPIALGPIKTHIEDEISLRQRFRRMIYTVHGLTIIIALGFDLYGLTNWPGLMTLITTACLFIQIYKMHKSRGNRQVSAVLTPRESLVAALRQNKINLRNAWIFSHVIPFSGLIGGLIGGLGSRFFVNVDHISNSANTPFLMIIIWPILIACLAGLTASHIIGKRVVKAKTAERAELQKRLTLLDAGLV